MFRQNDREPCFLYLADVLSHRAAPRPVMYDFIIGRDKEHMLLDGQVDYSSELMCLATSIRAFDSAGFDHASVIVRGLDFVRNTHPETGALTKSLNEGTVITDRQSFDSYIWPEIDNCDFSILDRAAEYMQPSIKMIPFSLDGILENTIGILGFENMCYLLYDDPQLVEDVFECVGRRLVQYFKKCLEHPAVGAVLCNDDWGFNSQTMIRPELLKKYVFPWYREVAEYAHSRGKFAIQHSCGYFGDIIDGVVEDIKFDGRHSYEDNIVPVERAYEELCGRIAVLGGIDVDFLARSSPEAVYTRCRAMVLRAQKRGGYALGSGNSVPDYIPNENYAALLRAANEPY